jgi:SAM-dependent methyltransferase
MKKLFLDLGKQPIANGFIEGEPPKDEFFFDLKVVFDEDTKLVSLAEFVKPELMFNDSYVYVSSMSQTMRTHFTNTASSLKEGFSPTKVLEIGSNDGVFIKNFDSNDTIAVEPCSNFAEITNDKGYHTYPEFWTTALSSQILEDHGKQDLIFSANCMCHIQDLDDAFTAIKALLSDDGVFVFEDPALDKMIERNSYDQIYDEHAHIFSVTALKNILNNNGLDIFRVDNLSVHGGTNRLYVKHKNNNKFSIQTSVDLNLQREQELGLKKYSTYVKFAKKVKQSKSDLVNLLDTLKKQGKKIVSYGATSKSTTVFNYCGITTDQIDYIVDTTPHKQGKLSPGTHIPVVSPETGFNDSVDVAFLGAWNFEDEILSKESNFIESGGFFVSHVPQVRQVR